MSDYFTPEERAARALSLLVQASRVSPELRSAVAEVEAEMERLTRRCEVYAAGLTAIAIYEGEHGLGYETPKRIANQALDRATNSGRCAEDSP